MLEKKEKLHISHSHTQAQDVAMESVMESVEGNIKESANTFRSVLQHLQARLFEYYDAYINGNLTQAQYISCIKPIDQQIDKLELSTVHWHTDVKQEVHV